MYRILFTIVVFISFALCYTVSEEEIFYAQKLNDLLVNCRFDEALSIADSLIKADPQKPLYYYMALAAIGLKTLDTDEPHHPKRFTRIYDSSRELVERLSREGESSDLYMMRGFLRASYFSYMMLTGKYFSALDEGMGALRDIEKAKELDSTNYDADYFIGFYSLARGELRNRLRFLLFWMPDATDDGIERLYKCMNEARFMNSAAAMVLVDVYVRNNQLSRAKPLLDSLQQEFPQSRFLKWTEGRYWEAKDDFRKAAEAYSSLSRSYLSEGFVHNALVTGDIAVNLYEKARLNGPILTLSNLLILNIDESSLSRSDRNLYRSIDRKRRSLE